MPDQTTVEVAVTRYVSIPAFGLTFDEGDTVEVAHDVAVMLSSAHAITTEHHHDVAQCTPCSPINEE